MKNLFLISFISLVTVISGYSQVPDAFNYQSVVRNASGEIIANSNISFRISILKNSETGTLVYVETHSALTDNFGLTSLKIGKGTLVSGVFDPSDWGAAPHFIRVEVDPAGGNSYIPLGTSQLLSVPYAFHAQTVAEDQVDDADADPNNEIQTLSLSGNDLSISDGNTVTLPASPWESSGNDIFFNSGNVGIGTSVPYHNVSINGKDASATQLCLQNNSSGGAINDGLLLGINITNNASYLWNYENAVMAFGTNNKQQMLISAEGNVAIGEFLIPTAALHVNGNDGVLFEGTFDSGTIPKEGRGTRMMWYPAKAAFRCGSVETTEWDDLKVGSYSSAMGFNTIASGWGANAIGSHAKATGNLSASIGYSTEASGLSSTAIGVTTIASGDNSTAIGYNTVASGKSSTTMGYGTEASGRQSIAMGFFTKANSQNSTAIGAFNIGGGSPIFWVSTDPIFEIGNGTSEQNRSNAMTVLNNGNIGIGTRYPQRLLHIVGANPRILIEASSSNPEINFKNDGDETTSIWSIYKNSSTSDLQFYQNGNKLTLQKNTGNVGIGTTTPQGKLDVNGTIFQRGGILHADYVFEENYQLESIEEHTDFMWENKHLPAIPKATVDENGFEIVEVGSHRKGIVEELEKAHIYISQLEKAIQEQAAIINDQESRLEKLESFVKAIASK